MDYTNESLTKITQFLDNKTPGQLAELQTMHLNLNLQAAEVQQHQYISSNAPKAGLDSTSEITNSEVILQVVSKNKSR